MVDQIIDRRTIAIPGPMGDVTPAAEEARDAALQAREGAESAEAAAALSASSASASRSDAALSASAAAASAAEAEAFATNTVQVSDWNDAVGNGGYWSYGGAANTPVAGTLSWTGLVLTSTANGETVVFQEARRAGASYMVTWYRYRNAEGIWGDWTSDQRRVGWIYHVAEQPISNAAWVDMAFSGNSSQRFVGGVSRDGYGLVAPADGLYRVTAAGLFATDSAGRRDIALSVNGSLAGLPISTLTYTRGVPQTVEINRVIPLDAGDVVTGRVLQTSGALLNVQNKSLSIEWLG